MMSRGDEQPDRALRCHVGCARHAVAWFEHDVRGQEIMGELTFDRIERKRPLAKWLPGFRLCAAASTLSTRGEHGDSSSVGSVTRDGLAIGPLCRPCRGSDWPGSAPRAESATRSRSCNDYGAGSFSASDAVVAVAVAAPSGGIGTACGWVRV